MAAICPLDYPRETVLTSMMSPRSKLYFRLLCYVASLALVQLNAYAGRADSLRHVLTNESINDTTRVLVLADLAWEHKNHNTRPDSILYYAGQGHTLAQKVNFDRGIAICSLHFGMAYALQSKYSLALTQLKGAQEYFEARPPSKELNEIYHNIGLVYYLRTMLEDALPYFQKSLEVAESINKSRVARAHYYLADVHNELGNFTEALHHYLEALQLYEKGNKKSAVSNCYTNIATIYAQLKDTTKCEEYVAKSLQMFADVDNPEEKFQNYTNIGIVYTVLEDYPKALRLFEAGLRLTDSLNDSYWNAVFLLNIAEVYTKTGRDNLALTTYDKVLKWNNEVGDVNFLLAAHSGIGRMLFENGKRKEGISHLLETLRLVQQNKLKRLIMETASELATMYEKDNRLTEALEYTKLFHAYRDSIFNEKNDKKIQQLQFDYELEKKERQIESLKKNREIQKERSQKQTILNWSLVVILLLLTSAALILYRSRKKEMTDRIEIQQQRDEIEKQADKLRELNDFKDKTFSVLSHDLRGPINSITTTIQMLNDKDITPEEYAELKPDINNQLNALNLLLDNVLLWAKSHMNEGIDNTPEKVSLFDMIEQNIALLSDAADRKQITLLNRADKNVYAYCNQGQIDVVLRNLIMNAIKYTDKGGSVTIEAYRKNGDAALSVTDTGVGMSPEQVAGLFRINTHGNTYGTAGEKGVGLGLLLCSEFVQNNKGTITAESQKGIGSKFTVVLPAA